MKLNFITFAIKFHHVLFLVVVVIKLGCCEWRMPKWHHNTIHSAAITNQMSLSLRFACDDHDNNDWYDSVCVCFACTKSADNRAIYRFELSNFGVVRLLWYAQKKKKKILHTHKANRINFPKCDRHKSGRYSNNSNNKTIEFIAVQLDVCVQKSWADIAITHKKRGESERYIAAKIWVVR